MNQISSALAQAGVKLPPLIRRVWQILHDSKVPRSAKALSAILNLPQTHVSSTLSNLHSRGMVVIAQQEFTHCKGPKGSVIKRRVALYSALGNEYELLPKRYKKPAAVKGTAFPLTPQTTRTTSLVQVVGPIQRTADDILNMLTLREARAVFDELKKVFGGV